MTKDTTRQMIEQLVVNIYDGLLKWMDAEDKDTMTREEIMRFKLNFEGKRDLT